MNKSLSGRQWRIAVAAAARCGLACTLLSGPLCGAGVALAGEANEVPVEESSPQDDAEDASGQPDASPGAEDGASRDTPDKAEVDESEEIFVPSEDISEDIDVPFPVDI